jgi:hypothetical protein
MRDDCQAPWCLELEQEVESPDRTYECCEIKGIRPVELTYRGPYGPKEPPLEDISPNPNQDCIEIRLHRRGAEHRSLGLSYWQEIAKDPSTPLERW